MSLWLLIHAYRTADHTDHMFSHSGTERSSAAQVDITQHRSIHNSGTVQQIGVAQYGHKMYRNYITGKYEKGSSELH